MYFFIHCVVYSVKLGNAQNFTEFTKATNVAIVSKYRLSAIYRSLSLVNANFRLIVCASGSK